MDADLVDEANKNGSLNSQVSQTHRANQAYQNVIQSQHESNKVTLIEL